MTITCLLEFSQQVTKAYDAHCEPLCRDFQISRTSFDILMFLANNPRFYTARDISIYRNIRPNVVSLHVDQLVREGYLLRREIPEDRRKVRLCCTEQAAPLIRAGLKMQKAFHERLVADLSEEELSSFKRCFQIITRNSEKAAAVNFTPREELL